MTTSMFLAQIIGPLFLLGGLGILLGSKNFMVVIQDMMASPALLFIMGFFTFILGALVVSVHNVWVYDWTVIITILGWISLLKGATMLVFPRFMDKMAKSFLKPGLLKFGGFIWLLIGAIICYMAWM